MRERIKTIYIDNNGTLEYQGSEDDIASINDIELWTSYTGDILEGVFKCKNGIFTFMDLTFLDEWDFCGYVKINEENLFTFETENSENDIIELEKELLNNIDEYEEVVSVKNIGSHLFAITRFNIIEKKDIFQTYELVRETDGKIKCSHALMFRDMIEGLLG